VTVLTPAGTPTAPVATRLVPPASRMGPLTDGELAALLQSAQVRKYATAVDRDSARELLARRVAPAAAPADEAAPRGRHEPSTFEQILKSPVTRTVAGEITRGVLGALLGSPRRRF